MIFDLQPTVSVIVPVYNVEKYLSKCIDSILAQSFTDFELILVNDGSSDNCGKICDEYAKKDERIKVIHKKNGGLSDARNTGLNIAKGKYVYFVDSDDYIEKNLLSDCIPFMESGYDTVAFGFYLEYNDGSVKTSSYITDLGKNFNISSYNEKFNFIVKIYLLNYIGLTAWSRIYKRSIIENYGIRFEDNELIYAEDLHFMLCYIAHTDRICTLKDCYYHYIQRGSSLVHQGRYAENIGRVDILCKKLLEYYRQWDSCQCLVKNFSLIYFMIMKIHIDEYQQNVSPNVIEIRKIIFENLSDKGFFENNISQLKKYRRLLWEIYGKHKTYEIFKDYVYYLNGNERLLWIKNSVYDKLYILRKRINSKDKK